MWVYFYGIMDKYDISHKKLNIGGKPLFIFVNHKTAVICWAKMKKEFGLCDVLTFDSHKDFRDGAINGEDPGNSELYYGSKYNSHLKHFKGCGEFLKWNILDEDQNKKLICQEKRFLFYNNDNFIDVAFMKNVVSDVYWYYLNSFFGGKSGKCDDVNGKIHKYYMKYAKKFKNPKNNFILDIDLDFFAKEIDWKLNLISDKMIKEYLILCKKLSKNNYCLGITIALEPGCCGGKENCLKLCEKFSEIFGVDIANISKKLIMNYQQS